MNDSVGSWSVAHVCGWARNLAQLSEGTVAALQQNEVQGDTLLTLTKEEIKKELAIRGLQDRRDLWNAIERLKMSSGQAHPSELHDVHQQRGTGETMWNNQGNQTLQRHRDEVSPPCQHAVVQVSSPALSASPPLHDGFVMINEMQGDIMASYSQCESDRRHAIALGAADMRHQAKGIARASPPSTHRHDSEASLPTHSSESNSSFELISLADQSSRDVWLSWNGESLKRSQRGMPPGPGVVGLANLGNSCYLNSTLQCLSQLTPLTRFALQARADKGKLLQSHDGVASKNVLVSDALAVLLREMHCGDYSVLAPRLFKQAVARRAPHFDNGGQQDGHEYCQLVLDLLQTEFNVARPNQEVKQASSAGGLVRVSSWEDQERAAKASWESHLAKNFSVVSNHFQGQLQNKLTCPHCLQDYSKFDVYSCLSLPLPPPQDSGIRLEDCLQRLVQTEQLDAENAWYCPTCQRNVSALQTTTLWSVSDVLILHLKRFSVREGDSYHLPDVERRDDVVELPLDNLDLSKWLPSNQHGTYRLRGVMEHIGQRPTSGHYTATVRNELDGHWYRCSDSRLERVCTPTQLEALRRMNGAYVLFYQRM